MGLCSELRGAAERKLRASPMDSILYKDAGGVRVIAKVVDQVAPTHVLHRATEQIR